MCPIQNAEGNAKEALSSHAICMYTEALQDGCLMRSDARSAQHRIDEQTNPDHPLGNELY